MGEKAWRDASLYTLRRGSDKATGMVVVPGLVVVGLKNHTCLEVQVKNTSPVAPGRWLK